MARIRRKRFGLETANAPTITTAPNTPTPIHLPGNPTIRKATPPMKTRIMAVPRSLPPITSATPIAYSANGAAYALIPFLWYILLQACNDEGSHMHIANFMNSAGWIVVKPRSSQPLLP